MSDIVVGVDAGGTKTIAIVAEGARIIARAAGPAAKMRSGRGIACAAAIAEVARRALADTGRRRAEALVAGVAGAGREEEREELRQALRSEDCAERLLVTGDTEIALAAAFGDRPGIVVTAGTGSIAVARDVVGRLHRAGGLGWQMGDEGSGYAIGRAALGAVGRAADGRSPRTELTPLLLQATHSETIEGLVRWAAAAGVSEVAALAPAVMEGAQKGDTIAAGIVDYAARELAALVYRLLPHFGVDERAPVDTATNGGLLIHEGPLSRLLRERLSAEPRIRLRETPLDAATGAIHLAAKFLS
ncbi:MAG TPA: BadF/BadG/BcrA/BcrD ATPase family protein [Gemmatimonadales bacterium]|nr:BadF/BadG/BcrA/BcrD ATPase family protein [Gemmatimonadales bacterium]